MLLAYVCDKCMSMLALYIPYIWLRLFTDVIFDAEFDSAIKTKCLIRNEHNEHCSALNLSDLAVAYIDRLKRYDYVSPSHEPYSYLIKHESVVRI